MRLVSGAKAKVLVFNARLNNISVISWWSVLLVEETGVSAENHRTATSHWITLSHFACIGICKSNFLGPSFGFTTCGVPVCNKIIRCFTHRYLF